MVPIWISHVLSYVCGDQGMAGTIVNPYEVQFIVSLQPLARYMILVPSTFVTICRRLLPILTYSE